jgi:hypothetical protein
MFIGMLSLGQLGLLLWKSDKEGTTDTFPRWTRRTKSKYLEEGVGDTFIHLYTSEGLTSSDGRHAHGGRGRVDNDGAKMAHAEAHGPAVYANSHDDN